MYAALTWLGGMRLLSSASATSAAVFRRWALAYAAYALLDEWLQQFTGRSPEVADWLVDVGGVATATWVLIWYHRQKGETRW